MIPPPPIDALSVQGRTPHSARSRIHDGQDLGLKSRTSAPLVQAAKPHRIAIMQPLSRRPTKGKTPSAQSHQARTIRTRWTAGHAESRTKVPNKPCSPSPTNTTTPHGIRESGLLCVSHDRVRRQSRQPTRATNQTRRAIPTHSHNPNSLECRGSCTANLEQRRTLRQAGHSLSRRYPTRLLATDVTLDAKPSIVKESLQSYARRETASATSDRSYDAEHSDDDLEQPAVSDDQATSSTTTSSAPEPTDDEDDDVPKTNSNTVSIASARFQQPWGAWRPVASRTTTATPKCKGDIKDSPSIAAVQRPRESVASLRRTATRAHPNRPWATKDGASVPTRARRRATGLPGRPACWDRREGGGLRPMEHDDDNDDECTDLVASHNMDHPAGTPSTTPIARKKESKTHRKRDVLETSPHSSCTTKECASVPTRSQRRETGAYLGNLRALRSTTTTTTTKEEDGGGRVESAVTSNTGGEASKAGNSAKGRKEGKWRSGEANGSANSGIGIDEFRTQGRCRRDAVARTLVELCPKRSDRKWVSVRLGAPGAWVFRLGIHSSLDSLSSGEGWSLHPGNKYLLSDPPTHHEIDNGKRTESRIPPPGHPFIQTSPARNPHLTHPLRHAKPNYSAPRQSEVPTIQRNRASHTYFGHPIGGDFSRSVLQRRVKKQADLLMAAPLLTPGIHFSIDYARYTSWDCVQPEISELRRAWRDCSDTRRAEIANYCIYVSFTKVIAKRRLADFIKSRAPNCL
ncbi:hypothetical protein DFP72DRAFT_1050854 [Ephemerocybe angulata]|uniref:Uncharacterized protein n=1 Tax=Ephemerocybe angulata TaxID=980116 RepID=A0A8H6HFM7_9AGAR|nr:hypothetical protein DFP72DRAFT_1050854 [Tulosesus angulatus]